MGCGLKAEGAWAYGVTGLSLCLLSAPVRVGGGGMLYVPRCREEGRRVVLSMSDVVCLSLGVPLRFVSWASVQ